MTVPRTVLPLSVLALWLVTVASILMIGMSFIDSWGRPVSALSGIATYSDIVDVSTGRILRHPTAARYAAVDLHRGDYIVCYDGYSWQQAQRQNWHERPARQAGEAIPLVVQRSPPTPELTAACTRTATQHVYAPEQRRVVLRLMHPNLWEQIALSRYALSAGACSIATLLMLLLFTRHMQRQATHTATTLPDQSTLPLFILTWLMMSIIQSVGSFKYPITWLWTDALTPMTTLLMGIISLPYPLAPRKAQPDILKIGLLLLGCLAAGMIIWNALQSPFPSDDWRRQVQLLRPTDAVAVWNHGAMVLGMCIATVGIFTTAFSASVRARLQRVVRALPARPARKIGELARWFEQTYGPCPPGIRILAWVQLLVIGMYVLLDLLPRLHGGVGAGYSVLFGIIPFSYLLLYSTIEGQKQGETMLRIIVVLVLAIQLPNQLWRFLTDTYGHAATVLDMVSIVVLLGGTLCGGIMIAFRQRGHTSALAASIDYLFHQETQATFWTHLTSEVGRVVGVSTWMWVIRQQPESWHLLEHTARARREWLEAPGVQAGLARLAALQPLSVVVDTTELPTTLLLLPIAREHMVYEVIIAANPQHVRGGKQLLDANLLSRLRDAVNALRFRERQQALAREQERLAVAYRRLHLQEQEEAGVAYIQAYALLHDGPLQQSSHLVGRLRTLAHELDTAQAARLLALVDDLRDIDTTTRAIFQDMGTLLVVEQLGVYVQERIREWEQQHPTITFMDETDDDEPPLTQVQRNQLALIIKQAVTNAIQHAQASRICISIRHRDGHLILTVSDDGQGFAAHHGTRHAAQVSPEPMQHLSTGLVVMRDLAHLLGARCAIESRPGAGCRVVVDMPLDAG